MFHGCSVLLNAGGRPCFTLVSSKRKPKALSLSANFPYDDLVIIKNTIIKTNSWQSNGKQRVYRRSSQRTWIEAKKKEGRKPEVGATSQ